jgi:3-methylcrotonyl-CoA carboxylase alpha subunit
MGIQSGSEITVHYDPMVAKIIASGPNRSVALQRMRRALRETMIVGLVTNQQFLLQVLDDPSFINGDYNTHFIQNNLPAQKRLAWAKAPLDPLLRDAVVLAALSFVWELNHQSQSLHRNVTPGFQNVLYKPSQKKFTMDEEELVVTYTIPKKTHKQILSDSNVSFDANVNGAKRTLLLERPNQNSQIDISRNTRTGHFFSMIRIAVDGQRLAFTVFAIPGAQGDELFLHSATIGKTIKLKTIPQLKPKAAESDGMLGNLFAAAYTGKILEVSVVPGQEVKRGDTLFVMETMKMVNPIPSPKDGKIAEVFAKVSEKDEVVYQGSTLVSFVPSSPIVKK